MKDKWFIINFIIFHKNVPVSNNIVYHMMYGSWDIRHDRQSFLLFWAIFCPLTILTTPKIKVYEKRKKKTPVDINILHLCTTNDSGRDRQNILLFWAIFCSFTPLTTQKIKMLKNLKKNLEKISFYTSVPYMEIIWCMVPEIWSATNRIFLWFWVIFCTFTPLTIQKIKTLKQWKKSLEVSSFYTSVPKIMIILAKKLLRFYRYIVVL